MTEPNPLWSLHALHSTVKGSLSASGEFGSQTSRHRIYTVIAGKEECSVGAKRSKCKWSLSRLCEREKRRAPFSEVQNDAREVEDDSEE